MAKSQIWKKKANYPKNNNNKIDLFLAFQRKAKKEATVIKISRGGGSKQVTSVLDEYTFHFPVN